MHGGGGGDAGGVCVAVTPRLALCTVNGKPVSVSGGDQSVYIYVECR